MYRWRSTSINVLLLRCAVAPEELFCWNLEGRQFRPDKVRTIENMKIVVGDGRGYKQIGGMAGIHVAYAAFGQSSPAELLGANVLT